MTPETADQAAELRRLIDELEAPQRGGPSSLVDAGGIGSGDMATS